MSLKSIILRDDLFKLVLDLTLFSNEIGNKFSIYWFRYAVMSKMFWSMLKRDAIITQLTRDVGCGSAGRGIAMVNFRL